MANITITNTQTAKQNVEELLHHATEISSVKQSISYILSELNEYWAVNQDRQSFENGLKKDVDVLTEIAECNKDFSFAIEAYVNAMESHSSRGIDTL